MGEKLREEPEISKPEHLAEGVRPIMACVGTREQYGEDLSGIKNIEKNGVNADFMPGTYTISSIDSNPKFTRGLVNCTSMIAVGKEKGTGDEISFVTHQTRGASLGNGEKEFFSHIAKTLAGLKKRCEENSVDVALAGGNINAGFPNLLADYVKSIEKLGVAVEKALGFEPIVICGPKEKDGDSVYFDTQKRRLYVIRPSNSNLHNEPFRADQVSKMVEKWAKE